MPRIRRIEIKNFRSINRLEIETSDLTVLVGDNDCGKSNIFRALNLFFNGETNPGEPYKFQNDWNRYAFVAQKQAKQIEIEIDLELPHGYRATNGDLVRWKKVWRAEGLHNGFTDYVGVRFVDKRGGAGQAEQEVAIPARSNVHALLRKIEFEYIPAVRSAEFFRKLRGRIFNVIAEVAEQGMRQTSGTFEKAIAGHVKDLISDISKTLGDEARISMPNDLSVIFERLDFLNSEHAISLDHRGDGIKGRYIPLILKFIADQKRSLSTQGTPPHTFIWAYEEPENNLEFRRAQQLAKDFCDLAYDDLTQVLLTTHSPVFFNLTDESQDRSAIHVSLIDPEIGTITETLSAAAVSLDERMGVMPIVAPYIQKAEQKIMELEGQQADIQRILSRLDLPAFFVEGITDYRVIKSILDVVNPSWGELVQLIKPPTSGAGTNYVADHLIAWQAVQKHKSSSARLKAFGILDNDKAGQKAHKDVNAISSTGRLVKSVLLPKPPLIQEAAKVGILIPVTLEECYPLEWWSAADEQNWLTEREPASVLSEAATRRILNGSGSTEQLFSQLSSDLIARKKVNPDYKVNWAKWASKKPKRELLLLPLTHLVSEGLTWTQATLD